MCKLQCGTAICLFLCKLLTVCMCAASVPCCCQYGCHVKKPKIRWLKGQVLSGYVVSSIGAFNGLFAAEPAA
jgi:hypothetical protein